MFTAGRFIEPTGLFAFLGCQSSCAFFTFGRVFFFFFFSIAYEIWLPGLESHFPILLREHGTQSIGNASMKETASAAIEEKMFTDF